MVQEKDAAKKRQAQREAFAKAERERYKKSVIRTVWVVVETTPAYNTGGYYDTDVPEKNTAVSPDFDTRDEAVEWMDRHEADKGNYLRIAHKDLRQISYKQWSPLFIERNRT